MTERSLADAPAVAPEVTPEDFDIEAWISGVRPTRRAVKLHPNAHLLARMDEIADEIDSTPEGEDVDGLIDEFEDLKRQFEDGVWFTVEKRSTEWVKQFRKRTAQALGVSLTKGNQAALESAAVTVGLAQVAAQTVSPAVTLEQLSRMYEVNQGEVNKLVSLVKHVNEDLAEDQAVMTRDFSRRRSAPTPG